MSKKQNPEEEKERQRATLTRRVMIWMRNGLINSTNKIEELYNKAANSEFVKNNYARYDKLMHNPVVKILSSNTLSRSIATVFITSAAMGITAGGWPVAGAGIAAVAIGMAIDTAIVDKTRRLYKEAKFLHRHREASDKEKIICKQNPHIAEALKESLYKPKNEGKSTHKRLTRDISTGRRYTEGYLTGLAIAAVGCAASIVGAVFSHSPMKAMGAAGSVAFGALGQGSRSSTLSQKREDFREYIDSERDRNDSPAYDNLLDIKKAAREQKIQTMALKELIKDPQIMSPTCDSEMIKAKFENHKKQIESKESSIIYGNNALYRTSQVAKNFLRAHNPFSEYSEPPKVGEKLFAKIEEHKKSNTPTQQWNKEQVSKAIGTDDFKSTKPDVNVGNHRNHNTDIKKQRTNNVNDHGR